MYRFNNISLKQISYFSQKSQKVGMKMDRFEFLKVGVEMRRGYISYVSILVLCIHDCCKACGV